MDKYFPEEDFSKAITIFEAVLEMRRKRASIQETAKEIGAARKEQGKSEKSEYAQLNTDFEQIIREIEKMRKEVVEAAIILKEEFLNSKTLQCGSKEYGQMLRKRNFTKKIEKLVNIQTDMIAQKNEIDIKGIDVTGIGDESELERVKNRIIEGFNELPPEVMKRLEKTVLKATRDVIFNKQENMKDEIDLVIREDLGAWQRCLKYEPSSAETDFVNALYGKQLTRDLCNYVVENILNILPCHLRLYAEEFSMLDDLYKSIRKASAKMPLAKTSTIEIPAAKPQADTSAQTTRQQPPSQTMLKQTAENEKKTTRNKKQGKTVTVSAATPMIVPQPQQLTSRPIMYQQPIYQQQFPWPMPYPQSQQGISQLPVLPQAQNNLTTKKAPKRQKTKGK